MVLPRIDNANAKGEYYLTDVVHLAREEGRTAGAFRLDDVVQTDGANDRAQLAALGAEMNRRILDRWMRDGVTILDPASTWIDADVRLAPDVTLLPGVQLHGATTVDEDAVVGPDCTLKDVEVGAGAHVVRTHAELAVIGAGRHGRPVRLPPARHRARGGRQDRHVRGDQERRDRPGGEGAAPVLRRGRDDRRGREHRRGHDLRQLRRASPSTAPRIGAYAKTASNNTFVAPVTVGDGAATGAGA